MFDGFKPSLEQTEEGWREIFDVNVLSFFLSCNAVLPYMIKNGGGSIINISAVAALTGGAGGAAYCASRHAIAGYTKQLCVDYASRGVRANAIAAGSVMSPVLEAIFQLIRVKERPYSTRYPKIPRGNGRRRLFDRTPRIGRVQMVKRSNNPVGRRKAGFRLTGLPLRSDIMQIHEGVFNFESFNRQSGNRDGSHIRIGAAQP
jgi:NAD(P)-dependent dehydrogenase (short-subunit alcohol dehydrogenase family)